MLYCNVNTQPSIEKWLTEEEWLGEGEEYVCVVGEDRGRSRAVVSDEIRATIIDHVTNCGLSMRKAGLRVQPNLQRSTVESIVVNFWQNNT